MSQLIVLAFFIGTMFVIYFCMYYLYLIESETSGKYYIGQTSDLYGRIADHNGYRKKYTQGRGPWRLIGYKCFPIRRAALTEERRLKKAKNKRYIYYYFSRQA